ncbi:MAG: cyanophycin synthetase, partial [Acidobacteriota bacterium]
ILHQQTATDIAILNADDPWVVALETPGHRRLFSLRGPVADGCYLDDAHVVEITAEGERVELFATADMHIEGRHNLANAMAAALLARSQGVEPEAIVRGLAAFDGLPHRLERVAEIGGVVYWDDSKGTNVGATIGSLAGFEDGTVHVILGGDPKDQDFAPLAPVVAAKARAVYLIGEAAPALAEVLDDSTDILQVETLDRAVSAASRVARSGEAVVLSPACASFDQFRNFIARGRAFQALVRELQHGGTHGA